MNNKTKAIAGGSVAAVIMALIHLVHGIISLSDSNKKEPFEGFKNMPVTVIRTDSLGRKDTILMEEHWKAMGR